MLDTLTTTCNNDLQSIEQSLSQLEGSISPIKLNNPYQNAKDKLNSLVKHFTDWSDTENQDCKYHELICGDRTIS